MTPSQILRVGHTSTTCRTRALNQSAGESLATGDLIAAAIKLRESARQLAEALIDYYAAWGAKMKNDRTAARMVKCLVGRVHISGGDASILYEALVLGNRFAHCVRPKDAETRLLAALDGMLALADKFDDIIGGGDAVTVDNDGCELESEVPHGR